VCDTLVSVTDDGLLFAKNSDRDPNEAQLLEWVPAADHRPGADLACTHVTIAQVAHTHAVLLSRPWWMWGAEIGANEHGVVIGNEAVFTRVGGLLHGGSEQAPGLLGMDLLRLGLERATTAGAAVEVIVDLLERHGQGGSCSLAHPGFSYDNSFIVADPSGAVVLETAGRSHAVEQVRTRGRSISNGLTIAGFARANADPVRGRVAACAARRLRTEAHARRARGVADLFAALRDHGPGATPAYSPLNGALSAPCAHPGGLLTSTQTTASWVADLRGPVQHWATATAAPCTSIFKPVSVDSPVEGGPAPADAFDDRTPWWRHERLHRASMRDPAALVGRYAAERAHTEQAWLRRPPPSADAFAVADDLEQRWLADVLGVPVRDLRPALVRRLWRRWDRAAGMPAAAIPGPPTPVGGRP
jgi:dipeptidase